MVVELRLAQAGDLDEIVELCARYKALGRSLAPCSPEPCSPEPCSPEPCPFEADAVRRCLEPLVEGDEEGVIIVAGRPGAGIVGYLLLTWGYSLESGGREALVDEFYVDDRQQGTGSAMVDAAIVECERRGVKRMFLETEIDNEGARRLYARKGFAIDDSIWMSRWLKPFESVAR